jgi:hypothetical protein
MEATVGHNQGGGMPPWQQNILSSITAAMGCKEKFA